MNKHIIYTVIVILFLSVSCKKKQEISSTCPSQLYGNSSSYPYASTINSFKSNIGILDLSTNSFASYTTIPFLNSDRQSCFNPDDNCYYMFQTYGANSKMYSTLYKIDADGSITGINAMDSSQYSSLIYNQKLHKIYCIGNNKIGEVSIDGALFSIKNTTGPIRSFIQNSASITVDNTTGDMYYITGDVRYATNGFFIEKYNPANSQPVVVAGINALYWETYRPWELCYNKNDKMLYAVKYPLVISPATIIKIDPSSGSNTGVYVLGYFDTVLSSSCVDPCNNRYYLSMGIPYTHNSFLYKFDLSSNTVTKDTLKDVFVEGLNFR